MPSEDDLTPEDQIIHGLARRKSVASLARKTGWHYQKIYRFARKPLTIKAVAELRLDFLRRVKNEVIQLGRSGLRDLRELSETTEDDKIRMECSKTLANLLNEMLKSEGLLGEVSDLSGRLATAEMNTIRPETLDEEVVMKIIQETSFKKRKAVTSGPDADENRLHGPDVAQGESEMVAPSERPDVDPPVRPELAEPGKLDGADPGECPQAPGEELLSTPDMLGEMSEAAGS